ncbi:Fe(3+) ABC transporter substrate-binding protein [Aliiroseovarius lamellibrachiae]|uniref:Fe(3+) ABC transporter substrate-binding protein n=1 Tax=Aliiroseovarius lamellibrachiae TaxID=1924933 RepID=UPI001BDF9C25|nr:Fe(3+) ABC transporter substrate-binding protein [Aliiroseovarius lamellibrachiae]MBT2132594.1 Fe(3+) ABC transporter substrate-binding protein [Aliiroseovarius lamellibrachiae]
MKRTIITATILAATLPSIMATTASADDVNVYSYRQPELIQPLMDAFSAQTGHNVNVAFLQKGMIERLQAEGKRSPADLILTTDISRLAGVVDAGLTQPVQSDTLKANIPAQYRDTDDQWFGLTSRARIVYASKDRVNEGDVTTYEDLADPKWKGRICTRSGTHAYTLAMVAAYLKHHGPEATTTWLEGVKANLARKPQGNDRAQVKAIWAGECDIAIGNTYYMGKMLSNDEQKAWANSVNVVFPTFENSGTHVNVSGMALTKYAPNKEAAIALMEFLASPKAQEIYAATNFEYPIAPGTQADPLVQSWGSFVADDLNLMEVAAERPAALKLIEEIDFDG